MELIIYDKTGKEKKTVSPDVSSQWVHEVGVENVVTVNFTTWEFFVSTVGDYIMVDGRRFSIKKEYRPKQASKQKYTYNLKFYGREHDTEDILFCRLNQGEDDLESVFAYDGTPMDFLLKVVQNMNRNTDGVVWKVGEAIDVARQNINFNGLYCWDALAEIAKTFETEWWMDGEYLNLSKCEHGEAVPLGYLQGLKSGLTQQENTNAIKWFTRLIPVGSSKNIDPRKYGYPRLQLPSRAKSIDLNTQLGLKEHREEAAFTEIFPHRTGTISAVRSEVKTNEETGEYTVYYIKDKDLPFNPDDYMLPEQVIHIVFQSGYLMNKDFEANWHNDTQEFEIINIYPDDDSQLPGGNFIPATGNTYILYNLRMPDEYYPIAERQYELAVNDFLSEYSKDISIYSADTDYIYVDKNSVPLSLGQRVKLVSDEYFDEGFRDSRITRVTRKLNNLSEAAIECSNAVGTSWKGAVESDISGMKYTIAEQLKQGLVKILKTGDIEVPSEYNVFSALRSFGEFVSKKKDDIVQGIITFVKKIKSLSGIDFGTFVAGSTGGGIYKDEQGNWHFEGDFFHVRKKLTAEEIEVQRTTHIGGKLMNTAAGMICNKLEEHDTFWRCFFKTEDADGRKVYNQFRVDDQAYVETFNLVKQADGTMGNHYLWRLVVNVGDDYIDISKTDAGVGSDAPMVGDDIVQLGNRTDKTRQGAIIDASAGTGSPYIRIYKGINSYTLPKPVINLNPEQSEIYAKIYNEATGDSYDDILADLNEKIGNISTQDDKQYVIWFEEYTPTNDNLPASEWTTDELRSEHEYDMFYNKNRDVLNGGGRAYMWTKHVTDDETVTYSWDEITDRDTLLALEAAARAQDTADGKRRVFVAQPGTRAEYDIGDLWVNAVWKNEDGTYLYNDETLVCQTAKKDGQPFSIDHWKPSTSITRAFISNFGNEIVLGVGKDIDSVRGLANSAWNYANTAWNWADSAYDKAKDAWNWADHAWDDAIDAQSKAEAAAKAASTAQSRADDAYGLGTSAQSAVSVLEGKVTAVSGRFTSDGKLVDTSYLVLETDFGAFQTSHFNSDGSLKNTAGLVISSGTGSNSFANLFTSYANAAGYANEASIKLYVDQVVSRIDITADKINLNGYVNSNGLTISQSGYLTCSNASINTATIKNSFFSNCYVSDSLSVNTGSKMARMSPGEFYVYDGTYVGQLMPNKLTFAGSNTVELGVRSNGKIYMYANWPTSSTEVSSGEVYRDGTTLKVRV